MMNSMNVSISLHGRLLSGCDMPFKCLGNVGKPESRFSVYRQEYVDANLYLQVSELEIMADLGELERML